MMLSVCGSQSQRKTGMKDGGLIVFAIVVVVIAGLVVHAQGRIDACKRQGQKTITCVLGF